MSFVKCYDVAKMVVDEATERFGTGWCVSDDDVSVLEARCKIIDDLARRFNGVSYEVNVDEENTDITISLVCDMFEITDKDDSFFTLVGQSKEFSIEPCDKDSIQLKLDFVFDGIWQPVI